jgi:hypothetical protein
MKYLLICLILLSCSKKKEDIFKKEPHPINVVKEIPTDTTKS